LLETRLPLAVVAAECGFVDQTHLGRVLKRATGRTPLQIRAGR
jgi:transcriptional regulator GlxA family with amidase domain